MVIQRVDVYWVDLGEPELSRSAHRRPVLVISDDRYSASKIGTVKAIALRGTIRRAAMPNNVRIAKVEAGWHVSASLA